MNETTRQLIVHKVKHNTKRLITSIKWVIFSIVVGIVAGSCGTAFYFALSVVTDFRMKYPWLIYFLPIGGLAIVGLYHLCKDDNDTGTNLVISAIHSGDKVPFIMAPLIFVSTLITHLYTPIHCPRIPNTAGANIIPRYEAAICIPIMF